MNQFIGLVKKDWFWIRTEIYVALGFYAVGLPLLSLLLQKSVAKGYTLHEVIVGFSGLTILLGIIMPSIVLICLLHHDMKHPDIWLHTTASSTKLFGVKILHAGLTGLGIFLVTGVVVTLSYFPADISYSLYTLVISELSILLLLLYISFGSAINTLFFWVLFQVMRPSLRKFSLPIALILYILYFVVYIKLGSTAFYKEHLNFGEINFGAFKQETGALSLEAEAMFYVGDIAFDLILTITMFLIAIFLFNRKVRC